jgi:hypothetical protein
MTLPKTDLESKAKTEEKMIEIKLEETVTQADIEDFYLICAELIYQEILAPLGW